MKRAFCTLLSMMLSVSVLSSYVYAEDSDYHISTIGISGGVGEDSDFEFKEISGCTIAPLAAYVYTGSEIKPEITIYDGELLLIEGADYIVDYSDNINVGTAAVTVTGLGSYTGTIQVSFEITSPVLSAVTGLTASDNQTNSLTLSWDKVEGATGYVVQYFSVTYNKWIKLGQTAGLKFNAKNLKSCNEFNFRVRAFKRIDNKYFYGDFAYVKTATLPKKISTFTIRNITTSGYTLAWSKVSGATEYRVYRYNKEKKQYDRIATGNMTTYQISGKSAGEKDTYVVRAVKRVDGVNYFGALNKRNFATRPSKVTNVTTDVDRATLKISWSQVTNAEGYLIYYRVSGTDNYKLLKQINGNKTFSYSTKAFAGKKVYIRIKAYTMADSTKITGESSAAKYVRVFNNKTYNEVITNYVNSNSITISNAQGYQISSAKKNEIYNALTCLGGTASFALLDLDSGVMIGYNAKSYMGTASTVKMPYMLYALQCMEDGVPSMNTLLTYTQSDYSDGSSVIVNSPFGTKFTIRTVLHDICAYSDNCGYYMLQDYFGYTGYNNYIASLGCATSVSASRRWGVVSAADSTREWIEMYDYLYNGRYGYFMRNELKNSTSSNFRIGLGWKYTVYSKCGWTDELHHDTAVVEAEHPYVLVCLTDRVSAARLQRVARAADAIHDEMWSCFNAK